MFALLLTGAAAVLGGCKKDGVAAPPDGGFNLSEPRRAQPTLSKIQLWLGPAQTAAEMAVTPDEVMTGMMFRTNLPPDDTMIFVLPSTQQASFWMKNCYVPLSVAYISPDGVIQEIHPLEPQNTNPVYSASADIRFALETPRGWFESHNVRAGMVVRTERGSLMQTFEQQP